MTMPGSVTNIMAMPGSVTNVMAMPVSVTNVILAMPGSVTNVKAGDIFFCIQVAVPLIFYINLISTSIMVLSFFLKIISA